MTRTRVDFFGINYSPDTLRFMISFVVLLKKIMQGFLKFYGRNNMYLKIFS